MLDAGQHAAGHEALGRRKTKRRHRLRRICIGAVTDHIMRARHRHIEHGQAVDRDTDAPKFGGHQPRAETRRMETLFRIAFVKFAIAPPRRP